MFKKILTLLIVIGLYLLYARFVLIPQQYKNFSLIDDGQDIEYGQKLNNCLAKRDCNALIEQYKIGEGGKSRTVYWLFQSLLYQGNNGSNPEFQHDIRIYGLGMIIIILFTGIALMADANPLAIVLGNAIFITNYSFSENIIRLGPIEPYQVLLLAIFSLLFLYRKKIFNKNNFLSYLLINLSLIFFFLIKETSIALLPVLFLIDFLFVEKRRLAKSTLYYLFPTIIFVGVKLLLGRGSAVGVTYVNDYNLNLPFIIQNSKNFISILLVSTTPFIKITILITFLTLIFPKTRKIIFTKDILFWLLLFMTFTGILFPWKYVLDRYLLISVFCLSMFTALLFSKLMKIIEEINFIKKHKFIYYLTIIFIFFNLFLRGFSINFARTINYRNWFLAVTQFEADQVKAISKYKDNKVYINLSDDIDNLEIVYEIPMHLKFFYGGKTETERLATKILPKNGYLFSRYPLEPEISLDTISKSGYKLLESNSYYISQIDPIAFREFFKKNPIQALKNPPLFKDNIYYFWEIRKL